MPSRAATLTRNRLEVSCQISVHSDLCAHSSWLCFTDVNKGDTRSLAMSVRGEPEEAKTDGGVGSDAESPEKNSD